MKSCCLFCSIISDNEIQKVFKDDTNVIIEDIRPAADLHLLVIPKRHIRDITTVDDAKILDSLLLSARAHLPNFDVMKDKNVGFHQPPFNSQYHLHMHIVAGRMNARHRRRILNPGWADVKKAYELIEFFHRPTTQQIANAKLSNTLPDPSELKIPPPPNCQLPPQN